MTGAAAPGGAEPDQARLVDQLIAAEQDERRRIAVFLHDGAVQSLSGIALMLDAVRHAIADKRLDDAARILDDALERHRETIRSLRDLSFNLEPVVLRDQGFPMAVRALAEQVALANRVQIDVDLAAAETLAEGAKVALYQIIHEALNQAIRRGPPRRIAVRLRDGADGAVELLVSDDGAGERRRRSYETIEGRARTLSGQFSAETGADGGTVVRVTLPSYTARR